RSSLFERFDLYNRGTVVAADPQRAGILRIVHIHAPDVGRTWQHVFRILAALDIETRDAIGQHRPGPRIAVAIEHGIVGRAPGCGHFPFRHALRLGVEHSDRVALIFTEPQPSLAIDTAAPGAGVRRGSRIDLGFFGLGVDLDDVAG